MAARLGMLVAVLCGLMLGGDAGLHGMNSSNERLKTVYEDRYWCSVRCGNEYNSLK